MDFFVIWNMFHKSLKTVTVTSFLSHRSVQMPLTWSLQGLSDSLKLHYDIYTIFKSDVRLD
jgi:hypothetical protein